MLGASIASQSLVCSHTLKLWYIAAIAPQCFAHPLVDLHVYLRAAHTERKPLNLIVEL